MSIAKVKPFAICVLAGVLALALAACAQAKTGENSPHADVAGASISCSSNLDEASQLVDVTIPFDKAVSVSDGAAKDLRLRLDDEDIDTSAVSVSLEADGSDLHVLLRPAEGATGPGSGKYFALYQGKLEIAAADASGALPGVTGEDGSAAVLGDSLQATVPSGMELAQVSSKAGRTVVEVAQFAQIRCCTWFDVGGEQFYMHHHQFAQESPQSCAEAMASQLNESLSGSFTAKAKGDRVTVEGLGDNANRSFDVTIVEGVGA